MPGNKYGYYMIAFGAPELEASDSYADNHVFDTAYGKDLGWSLLQYPEFTVMGSMLAADGNDSEVWGDWLKKNLEIAHIEADTYKDLDDGENNVEDFVVYVNTTLNYSRPNQGALHLSSQA